jgi:hypothetical protein
MMPTFFWSQLAGIRLSVAKDLHATLGAFHPTTVTPVDRRVLSSLSLDSTCTPRVHNIPKHLIFQSSSALVVSFLFQGHASRHVPFKLFDRKTSKACRRAWADFPQTNSTPAGMLWHFENASCHMRFQRIFMPDDMVRPSACSCTRPGMVRSQPSTTSLYKTLFEVNKKVFME